MFRCFRLLSPNALKPSQQPPGQAQLLDRATSSANLDVKTGSPPGG